MSETSQTGLEIAVIGLACRFPGAADWRELWRNLTEGKESIRFYTDQELVAEGVPQELIANPHYVKAKPWLDDADGFDGDFFGYHPREARLLDPQIRALHECAWTALEDAGCDPLESQRSIALFAGVSSNLSWITSHVKPEDDPLERRFVAELNAASFATTIAYKLNLRGPAVSVQTACSTSLVAIHLAVQCLLSGEAEIALAGGASIELPKRPGYLFREGHINSPDGHCRAFDKDAGGTIFGDGVGLVVLKRLADAIRERDNIYAVVKGTAVNNDGSRKVSYNAPASRGQADAVAAALTAAEVEAQSISYVEAHGTATPVGDPIEVEALKRAFATEKRGFCALGSIKTNIGHLDAAAGVAGFIKTALALHHRVLPRTLNFREPNPAIDFALSPFYVKTDTSIWDGPRPLRAGVSSFGIGGTNAHAVLEEAPATAPLRPDPPPQLLVLSARTPAALAKQSQNLALFLRAHPDLDLADTAWTLQTGRASLPFRRTFVARSVAEAADQAADTAAAEPQLALDGAPAVHLFMPDRVEVPARWRLYEDLAVFRDAADACCEQIAAKDGGVDAAQLARLAVNPDAERHDWTPGLEFVFQYALAMTLKGLGLYPAATIGEGIGTHVANAVVATVSLQQAFRSLLRNERGIDAPAMPDRPARAANVIILRVARVASKPNVGEMSLLGLTDNPTADLLSCLGQLWSHGVPPRWESLHSGFAPRRVSLPGYPFERHTVARHTPDSPALTIATAQAPVRPFEGELATLVATAIKGYFGFEHLNAGDNFFDLGASSLDLVNLSAKLSETLGRDVATQMLLAYPNAAALTDFLSGRSPAADIRSAPIGVRPVASPRIDNAIAIVGMAFRGPGAADIDQFWENLAGGVESIRFYSDDELRVAGVPEQHLASPNYVRAKGELAGIEEFEPEFFNYSGREAELMDPQFRIFHECAWQALEHAGYDPERYAGSIGLYAGVTANLPWLTRILPDLSEAEQFGALLLNDREFFAPLFSYRADLRGPAISMQTACSTSLVNINLACRELLSGACDMALAGGVTITIDRAGYFFQEGSINSADGHTRAFDASSTGTVFGDGAGMVVLKRLADAQRDGDTVHALIRGVGINNDGHRKVGFTAPSLDGQAAAIGMALKAANVPVESIGYVEAHGTGTRMGDPIELDALHRAFSVAAASLLPAGFCSIGSVKSNVGHLNAAAGVAGLIKTTLALKHRQLPPTLFFDAPNPAIDFANGPFRANTTLTDWVAPQGHPRRAGVSSFGIGGTNAHAILEEAPETGPAAPGRANQLLVLSARTREALRTKSLQLSSHLQRHPEQDLADVSFTLANGRRQMAHRRTICCRDSTEAANMLAGDAGRWHVADWERPRCVLLFPGQGSQYPGMARELYQQEPAFRAQLDRCFDVLRPQLPVDPKSILFETSQAIHQTEYTQPLLFSVSWALARTLQEWNIHADGMIGHSVGEYVAACLAGLFGLEDALTLVATRGRLMASLPAGEMVSVPLEEHMVTARLNAELAVAAVNTDRSCVVSGPAAAIQSLCDELEKDGVVATRLKTSHAFHSPMMEPILADFEAVCKRMQFLEPASGWISNLDGRPIDRNVVNTPQYWVKHLRRAVRFAEGLTPLLEQPETVFVEVGPGRTLGSFVRRHRAYQQQPVFNLMRHSEERTPEQAQLLGALGALWGHGLPVDWARFSAHESRRRVPLPSYPFERRRIWPDSRPVLKAKPTTAPEARHSDVDRWFYLPGWKRAMAMPAPADSPSTILILADDSELGKMLAKEIASRGGRTVMVTAGEHYRRSSEGTVTIDPSRAAHFEQLADEIKKAGTMPSHVVNLLPLHQNRGSPDAYYSLMFAGHALAHAEPAAKITITTVTRGIFDVTAAEGLSPYQAMLLGPARVLPQEYRNLRCRLVDAGDARAGRDFIVRLLSEMDCDDGDVAWRGPHRWIRSYEQIEPGSVARSAVHFREGATYMILGGLGDIGRQLALFLARKYKARLAVTARSAEGISRRSQVVKELEALGSEVLPLVADLSNRDQLEQAMTQVVARFGGVDGVIHSAGLPGSFHTIDELVRVRNEEQFAAKVHGLENLRSVLKSHPPEFCLLFSSLSTVLGGLGYGSYTAVNAFMDVFAQAQSRSGLFPWYSIDWDAWRFEELDSPVGQELARLAIVPDDAGRVFESLLQRLPSQLVVSTADLQTRIDRWVTTIGNDAGAAPKNTQPRPQLRQLFCPPTSPMERQLQGIVAEYCRLEQVGIDDNFFELGLSSLDLIQLSSRIVRSVRHELSVVKLFAYPSIRQLAQFLGASAVAEAQIEPEQEVASGRQYALLASRRRLLDIEDEV
ncbi:SDR family NAD(P)-dependent oxidoreductase [Bradyrhizobium ontarionense]|uniref:SDR family NAD(P)-dependent oxidoreductase n=1 Tax=Bradyrhizobium ontarionense TaxID=2898149 RepID=A0ABY3RA45_9BRAD|nr:type I polyketide synthase [Bradyrhizobium sp. A19]UFZ04086.1 SDR family NAD(P)-dependent oxidoreductase [Bradyrhizobium sp. A19]